MRAAPVLLLLAACADLPAPEAGVAAQDAARVDAALLAARPEPLVELVDDAPGVILGEALTPDTACPLVEYLDPIIAVEDAVLAEAPLPPGPFSPGHHEIWHGGCTTADGLTLDGELELHQLPGATWIASQGFTARRDGRVEFAFAGAVEVQEQDALLLVDAAASWCGAGGIDCADGPTQVDLAFTLFPADGYPSAYDGTVSGAVGDTDGVTSVDGAWSVDLGVCTVEPTAGSFALRAEARHALEMDGAGACDGCAAWTVQGQPAPAWCAAGL